MYIERLMESDRKDGCSTEETTVEIMLQLFSYTLFELNLAKECNEHNQFARGVPCAHKGATHGCDSFSSQ